MGLRPHWYGVPIGVMAAVSPLRKRAGTEATSAMAAVSRLRKRAGTEATSAMAAVSHLGKRTGTEGHRKKATKK